MTGQPPKPFEGSMSLDDARAEAQRRVIRNAAGKEIARITKPRRPQRLSVADLVVLCDALACGRISSLDLSDMAFWMYASEEFEWDKEQEVIATTLMDWACPEVHCPLTRQTMQGFRARLLNGDLSTRIA